MNEKNIVIFVLPWIVGLIAVATLLGGVYFYTHDDNQWAIVCGVIYVCLIFGARKPFDDLEALLERRKRDEREKDIL